ncbi:hypothetical protein PR002_g14604 [Phytophthora rubi]|uniref:Uncharacterized protein n=1 Tax=Phytophthora rubi TaxID=129364 RepID=A0A6A3LAQ6_9STRA|nr:hypothetical protein PR002_g14604 [Phytophthora rubi]
MRRQLGALVTALASWIHDRVRARAALGQSRAAEQSVGRSVKAYGFYCCTGRAVYLEYGTGGTLTSDTADTK